MASKPKSTRRRKASDGARIRRKNLNIDQDKLDRVVELFGAESETDAIDRLLDDALFRQELLASLDNIPRDQGELVNYFEGGWSEELGKE
jgi:hypothetical protein